MMFRLFGMQIEVSFFFLAALAILLINDTQNLLKYAFLACILHESAHIFWLMRFGKTPKQLKFRLSGICLSEEYIDGLPFLQEMRVLAAGCAMNALAALLCWGAFYLWGGQRWLYFALCNLSLLCFNLLPVATLDGGRILKLCICRKCSLKTSSYICKVISYTFLCLLLVGGFLLLFWGKNNFTLLFTAVYLIIVSIARS